MGKKQARKPKVKVKILETPPDEPEELTRAPHSFVIHRGSVGKHVMQLMKDFRKVMEPFTASSLKVKKNNSIKDFVSISGLLHVSHMAVFTITETSPYMRLARLPQGPTLTFKIHDYSLARDVVSSLRKQYTHAKCFMNSPLIILNGFSGEGPQLKLMSTMFQSMFPTLNIAKLNLNNVKRCVMLNYNEETKCIDFRHYVIRVTPTGLNRGIKKVVLGKVPNLSKYRDVSDFVFKDELLSDMSEAEDEISDVVLPQKISSKGNHANNTSAIRLTELGPRLTLQLVKVEGGLMDGEVIFHEYVHKSEEEVEAMKKARRIKRRLKEDRRREQEKNVQRKEEEKALNKERSLEGMKRKAIEEKQQRESSAEEKIEEMKSTDNIADNGNQVEPGVEPPSIDNKNDDEDDDAEWYRREVGQEPEPELFASSGRGMKRYGGPFNKRGSFKKGRFSSNRDNYQDSKDRMIHNRSDRGGSRGRGSRLRPGTGRGRFQSSRGGFTSKSGFSNRDDYTQKGRGRGFSQQNRIGRNNDNRRGGGFSQQNRRGRNNDNRRGGGFSQQNRRGRNNDNRRGQGRGRGRGR